MKKALAAALFLTLSFSVICVADPPEYVVMRTTGEIVIDGVLDEEDWARAHTMSPFVFPWWSAGEQEQTRVKALWDDDYLYIAYSCDDRHIWAEIYDTNGKTYNDDAVELFWDPSGGVETGYNQCEVNCIGNMLSVRNPSRETIMTPRIGRFIYGSVNDDSDSDSGWTIELLLRFDEYSGPYHGEMPEEGDRWKIGLNRCGGKTNPQYSQWAPSQTTRPSFHQPDDFGTFIFSMLPSGTVSVEDRAEERPAALAIGLSPNPFNPSTTISYTVAETGPAELALFDLNGRRVAVLANREHLPGTHSIVWNGRDSAGNRVASGVYLARLQSSGGSVTKRMTLLK